MIPFQSRLSVHVLEGVLSEAIFCSGAHTASLDPTPQALEALEKLTALGIPPHLFWAAGDGESLVRWYGHPEAALVRSDAATGYGHSAGRGRPTSTDGHRSGQLAGGGLVTEVPPRHAAFRAACR